MAARISCCDDAARAARARRRVNLTRRRPSSTSSFKARRKPGVAAPSRKRVAIRRKMESLRRLVAPPSAERLDELLLHAAGYIMRLQMQVRVMQAMVHALNNPAED